MSRLSLLLVLFAAALGGGSTARAEGDWTQLKAGMTLAQVFGILGEPLIKSQSRGYDLWIYDAGAETIASGGKLIGWTAPTTKVKPATGKTVAKAGASPEAKSGPAKIQPEPKGAASAVRLASL